TPVRAARGRASARHRARCGDDGRSGPPLRALARCRAHARRAARRSAPPHRAPGGPGPRRGAGRDLRRRRRPPRGAARGRARHPHRRHPRHRRPAAGRQRPPARPRSGGASLRPPRKDRSMTDPTVPDATVPDAPVDPVDPHPASRDALREGMNRVRLEVGKAVVGQDGVVTGLLIALLARGHVLLEGVPGVAKTLLVRAFSRALGLDTKRIQFTPDLMPGDVSGSLVYDARTGEFEFREGPVFTNVVLADEINRTPPKTQAALLEAMEERQVSTDGVTRALPEPFLVCATQNPIEHEGTYTLPEAQLDRFLLKLHIRVPERDAEVDVLRRHASGFTPRDLGAVEAAISPEEILAAQRSVDRVDATDDVLAYIVD